MVVGIFGGVDVLVVDDDIAVRSSFAATLRRTGYKVGEAQSGLEALDYLRVAPAGVLVLDIFMPGFHGLELLDKLDVPPPVVLVTAHEYDAEVMARRHKVVSYLRKPVPPVTLLKAVEDALSQRTRTK